MSYKNLKLNLSDCEEKIQNIVAEMGGKVSSENKGNGLTQFAIEIPGTKKALLNVYDTARGLNISSKVGREQTLSNLIAKQISESCKTVITKTHTFNSINDNLYNEFIEFVAVDYEIFPQADDDSQVRIKISTGKPELTVTWYKSNHTLLVQGRTTNLWDDVVLWFADRIYENPAEIIEIVFDTYDKFDKASIKYDDSFLESLLKDKIEAVYNSTKILKGYEVKWLKTSLYLLKIDLDLPEYYPAISSAIKVVEGILKRVCMSKFGRTSFNGRNFHQFEESPAGGGIMQLKSNYKSQLTTSSAIAYIEELYNFIRTKRHPYTHNPGAAPAELNSKEAAQDIFEEVISHVNQSINFERELF